MNWHFFFLLVAPFEHLKNNIIHFNPEAFYLFTFLKIYCFILCVCVHVCVECSCSGRPEASGLLEQESQMVVSH